MTLEELKASLDLAEPPPGLSDEIRAMWVQARGDWDAAHKIVQDIDTAEAAWVHAHQHREEGDDANAAYWYRRADRPVSSSSLAEEWDEIAQALLGGSSE